MNKYEVYIKNTNTKIDTFVCSSAKKAVSLAIEGFKNEIKEYEEKRKKDEVDLKKALKLSRDIVRAYRELPSSYEKIFFKRRKIEKISIEEFVEDNVADTHLINRFFGKEDYCGYLGIIVDYVIKGDCFVVQREFPSIGMSEGLYIESLKKTLKKEFVAIKAIVNDK